MTDFDKTFALEWCFPEASSILTAAYKSLDQVKGACIVGLDTSVLLAPYNLDSSSIAAIEKIYRRLIEEKRLVVPERAIREYAKNRVGKVAEMVQALEGYSSRTAAPSTKVIEFLGDSSDSKEVQDLSKQLKDTTSKLKETIKRSIERLSDGGDGDPILEIYKKILAPTIVPLSCTRFG
jgi:PIN domain-containing protein